MRKLVTRVVILAGIILISCLLEFFALDRLDARRHPERHAAKEYLQQQLGTMTSEQSEIAQAAADRDPEAAMIAATSPPSGSAWDALREVSRGKTSNSLKIEALALRQALRGNINQPTASGFADSAVQVVLPLEANNDGKNMLDDLDHLSAEEYANVIEDNSYLIIAPRLDRQYRAAFQRSQRALTPLLAAADPSQWDHLMALYQSASPRAEQLFATMNDPSYGYTYMLYFDAVSSLTSSGMPEGDAVHFIGVNAASVEHAKATDPHWVGRVRVLQSTKGPDNKTSLLISATEDPSLYWLAAHADPNDGDAAIAVLHRYAGTSVPAILTKYASPPELLHNAIVSLQRFDAGGGQTDRGAAAQFINFYQDNPLFKETLIKEGPRLIAALSSSGPDWLEKFNRNPADIDQFVDSDCKPVGKPWWTWVPGGNIAFLIQKKVKGQTTTGGDWGWAVFDGVIIFCPVDCPIEMVAEGGVKEGVDVAIDVGERTVERALADGAEKITFEAAAGAAPPSFSRYAAAGLLTTARFLISAAAEHPFYTAVLAGTISAAAWYLWHTPEERASQLTQLQTYGRAIADALAGVPGSLVKNVWGAASKLAYQHPIAAVTFYSGVAIITLLVFLLPLVCLRILIPDVYNLLITMIKGFLGLGIATIGWPVRFGAEHYRLRRTALTSDTQSSSPGTR
jgi:hypothetical protein